MNPQPVNVGIIGAGANTRLRHVPGFREIDGVRLLGVVNRSDESTRRAAEEFGIPRTYSDWRALVDDSEIDAVLIGTWPNMHCEVTCAALDAGRHVLTEARMARTAAEAHQMLAASRARPDLVAQIVPAPFGLEHHEAICELLADGFAGNLRELIVIGADGGYHDATQPLHWRQDVRISGLNTLGLGIIHETAMRWSPPPSRVFAQTAIRERQRPAGEGDALCDVTVPDSVQIVTQFGTQSPDAQQAVDSGHGLYHLSGIALFGPGYQIHLYGSAGTIKVLFGDEEQVWIGQAGAPELSRLELPPERRGRWRVEAEFIGAIRGTEKVRFTDFETGVQYMEFTEAVARSARSGLAVSLPLEDA